MVVNFDKLGTVVSGICAVHCAVTGIALGVLAMMGLGSLGSPIVDFTFVSLAILIGSVAGFNGYRKHGSWRPLSVFALGAVLFVAAETMATLKAPWAHYVHALFATSAGCSFVTFHIMNQRRIHAVSGCALHARPQSSPTT